MKLYGFNQFPRNQKIILAAQYAGVELTQVDLNPKTATEAEREELRKKNPNLKVPVLETPEGTLFESNAILRYIARSNEDSKLYGKDDFERALVDQFLDWTSGTLEPLTGGVIYPLVGLVKFDKESYDKSLESLKKTLRILDDRVKQSKFLAGDSITIADFAVFTNLRFIYAFVFDEKSRKPFHHLTKYFEAVANEENVKKVFGKPVLAKTALQPYTGAL